MAFWQLFEQAGCLTAATKLTQAACAKIGALLDLGVRDRLVEELERSMEPVLSKYSEYGAADSEGYQAVRSLARMALKERGIEESFIY